MHGGAQFLVHGQARSGGSGHAMENPSTTWACSSPTTSNEASLPRKGM